MSTQSLMVRIVPLSSTDAPVDGYWLTIEQIVEEKDVTAGEAAAMIDALFDLTPCVETEEVEEAEADQPADMAEAVEKIAEVVEVDLTACERMKMGTYQAQLKVIRSHPAIPYTLRLSVGKIIKTVIVAESAVMNVDVTAATSVVMTMPVQGNLRCSWQGAVIGATGAVTPPVIQATGNTLFWDGEATGTIRAEYDSGYDVVDVEIPGVPNYAGSPLGEPQDATVLAFYHGQVYTGDVTRPDEDRDELIAEICGWNHGSATTDQPEEPEEPEPTPPAEPIYGCIDYYPLPPFGSPVTEPWFFKEKCCIDGAHDGCRVRTSRREGGKDLSQDIRNKMTAEYPGPIEFIGVGPVTPAGCGTRYDEVKIVQQSCCEFVEPMAWDTDFSVEILAPGTSGLVGVTGGAAPYYWSIRGNGFALSADGRLRDGATDYPYVRIYALPIACGTAPIVVDDGCSVVAEAITCSAGRWIKDTLPEFSKYCPTASNAELTYNSGVSFTAIGGGKKVTQLFLNLYPNNCMPERSDCSLASSDEPWCITVENMCAKLAPNWTHLGGTTCPSSSAQFMAHQIDYEWDYPDKYTNTACYTNRGWEAYYWYC